MNFCVLFVLFLYEPVQPGVVFEGKWEEQEEEEEEGKKTTLDSGNSELIDSVFIKSWSHMEETDLIIALWHESVYLFMLYQSANNK